MEMAAGLQTMVNANTPRTIADVSATSSRAATVGAARNALEETKERNAPAASTEVNISENGRARLQAEQTNAAAATPVNQAANASQVARNAPVSAASATTDTQNDPMLTGAAPVTSAGEQAAATPGTPRAEAGRQQAEAVATQAEAERNNNQVNRQDVSPAVAQGIATYRGIFSN